MKSMSFPEPRIETSKELLLVGLRTRISIQQNTTQALWQRFVPLSKDIANRVGPQWYSVEVYPDSYFNTYDPVKTFEKWASVAVDEDDTPGPEGLEHLLIEEGLYAVFNYQGSSGDVHQLYRYIFSEWIPGSGFTIDLRPHFAIMGSGYKREDPDAQEEIWIPIRKN